MSDGTAAEARFGFPLDRFQLEALAAVDADAHVIVAAPTGSGKTVVAEHAIDRSLAAGRRSFYTAPIKALSNQKFRDLAAFHGPGAVGLLTGDSVIQPDAPIVVMTTEVLRNMIYARSSALDDLGLVVLDEVHFLQDTYRGPVWEEVIIHTPASVQLVCLSATISNAAQLAEWIEAVRGTAVAIVEQRRPVELTSSYLVTDRARDRTQLLPVFVDGQPNAAAARLDAAGRAQPGRGGSRRRPERGRPNERRLEAPGRVETVELLAGRDMLPAVYFIFSRRQCSDAASTCLTAGLRFTSAGDRRRIADIAEARLGSLDGADLDVLGYDSFLSQLEAGIAAHHAGMVPPFKEVVERCFAEGLVRIVFATETLAVGINMPARSVVIEKLTKFTGEHHEFLTPGEYTQLTGRAGRRGIDARGHAVVPWSPFVRFERVAELVASRSFHLRSAFRPTYNMAANLVRNYRPDEARHLLSMSFAQFQADRDIVTIEARLERQRRRLDDLVEAATSPYGDIWAYRASRAGERTSGARSEIDEALDALRPGAVIWINRGKYAGPAVVVSRSSRAKGTKLSVVSAQATLIQVTAANFSTPPEQIGTVSVPSSYQPDRPAYRRDIARRLARASLPRRSTPRTERRQRREQPVVDPIETDPDLRQRLRAAGEAERVRRDIADAERRRAKRTASLAQEFDRVLDVLTESHYVEISPDGDRWSLTTAGATLARLFHETELLVAECLREGIFQGLTAADLAGLLSVFVYEHRSPDPPPPAWFPSSRFEARWRLVSRTSDRLAAAERTRGLAVHRAPDPTFIPLAHAWVAGEGFAEVVEDEDTLSGGDFVRTMKQVIDLARQLAIVATDRELAATARRVVESGFRGVVADAAVSEHSDETLAGEGVVGTIAVEIPASPS